MILQKVFMSLGNYSHALFFIVKETVIYLLNILLLKQILTVSWESFVRCNLFLKN